LPLLMNQWCNVLRWEMRTRLFLRTAEFLWQEGHTAHVDEADAEEFTLRILKTYRTFAEEWMAMPVLTGRKTDSERFAGALRTYCIEALMQDNKALQAGTSHNLGQNFAKAFQVTFQNDKGELEYVWNTSWGVSTRLVGALVMTHGDDNGIITPPRLAQYQCVIVPIYKSDTERTQVLEAANLTLRELKAGGIRAHLDARDGLKPGAKYYEWEGRGVPFRLEIGPRDVAAGKVMLARRTGGRKMPFDTQGLAHTLRLEMDSMQQELLEAARTRREQNSVRGISKASFLDFLARDGGFAYGGWCGDAKCEADIKEETKATIRCLPDEEFRSAETPSTCMWCGRKAVAEAAWARAY
jgi:prolyl-tRNA synthetase